MTATCALMWSPRVSAARMVTITGRQVELPLLRWRGGVTAAEAAVLERTVGPVLDVGSGPGRFVAALVDRGVEAVGVDESLEAVAWARALGRAVRHGSVFDPLPDEGRWGTVLLLDGTIGVGGDPVRLLRRARQLLRTRGRVLVELDPPGSVSAADRVRIESHEGACGPWFDWAWLSTDDLGRAADLAGLAVTETWRQEQRWFAQLRTA